MYNPYALFAYFYQIVVWILNLIFGFFPFG